MENYSFDINYASLIKHGEQLCGDHVDIIGKENNAYVVVLADGMGSGVKAGILSTLTSKIISTMMAKAMSLEECIATIASTLPVCSVRGVAYSTFTIIRIEGDAAEIIEYDNPHVIVLRNGKAMEINKERLELEGKIIYRSTISVTENDVIIAISDGAIYAGKGKLMNLTWVRENVVEYMENKYCNSYSAKQLTEILLGKCYHLYEGKPGDDTTVCTVKVQKAV